MAKLMHRKNSHKLFVTLLGLVVVLWVAAGCTIVHKPAEFSPLTASLLVEIAEEAGLPPGAGWS